MLMNVVHMKHNSLKTNIKKIFFKPEKAKKKSTTNTESTVTLKTQKKIS